VFKKLAQLITPAPKRAPVSEFVPPAAPALDLSAQLKPLLKALTSAPNLEDPAAQEAISQLKHLGLKSGLYVTAFEIRMQMDLMPRVDHDGTNYQKERGYVLAGDFFFAHIARELQAVRAKSQPIGPNIFKGYCDEMVECLIRSGHARRAIEIPVLIIDELLASAVDYADRCEVFLELAQQAVLSMLTIITHYAGLHKADTPVRVAPGAPTPIPRGFASSFNDITLGHAQELQRRLAEIRAKASQMPALATAQNAAPGSFRNPLERDQALLTIANAAQYLPLCGIVKERIANILAPTQLDKATTFLRSAGDSYEKQGDIEFELHFTKLPSKRYQKAQELYTKAGDTQRAARVQAKLEKAIAYRQQNPL
jgi:hypothetical protein